MKSITAVQIVFAYFLFYESDENFYDYSVSGFSVYVHFFIYFNRKIVLSLKKLLEILVT